MHKVIPLMDWFKAVGIFLIVFGHLDGDLTNTMTAPVMLKQLGVVLFVFIMGWQLSQDKRGTKLIVFNRLFKILFWSVGFAVFMSILGLVFEGKFYRSNYMPFFAGVNVLFDFFPANPTTWFIGTYIHIVILWAVFFKKIRVSKKLIAFSLVSEILIRGFLMNYGLQRAYMLFFNWQTVFFLGLYCGEHRSKEKPGSLWVHCLIYGGAIFLWAVANAWPEMAKNFPFRIVQAGSGQFNFMVTSMMVTMVYTGHALLFYHLARRLPGMKMIRFFSRNSMIIFLAHMPLWYFIAPHMRTLIEFHPLRIVADLAILYLGIGLVSSLIVRLIPADRIKTLVYQQVFFRNETPVS